MNEQNMPLSKEKLELLRSQKARGSEWIDKGNTWQSAKWKKPIKLGNYADLVVLASIFFWGEGNGSNTQIMQSQCEEISFSYRTGTVRKKNPARKN